MLRNKEIDIARTLELFYSSQNSSAPELQFILSDLDEKTRHILSKQNALNEFYVKSAKFEVWRNKREKRIKKYEENLKKQKRN